MVSSGPLKAPRCPLRALGPLSPVLNPVPILVLANKQDLPGAKDPQEIERLLGIAELGNTHLWHIQPACAITGEGLDEALENLYEMIHKQRRLSKTSKKKPR
ncbi:ADP-ribosylation factor-like protein 4A [Penaeus japonicus]|uniref:ADP-ribosylation factor-like protein 4A n=1 Tax=Penaeus japonicus TaxID=27405 RepID=UPI001C713F53|nr:ADP-ribosylation factor-like protein 4A [Penaeus japonicus]